MPEVELAVQWADGHLQDGIAPSRVIERYVVEGGVYGRDELCRRLRDGLDAASERVRERYGFACTAAAELSSELADGARRHGGGPSDPSTIVRLRRRDGRPEQTRPLPDRVEVGIIGAGQAGLSLSWHLSRAGVEHVVLERDRMANAWSRGRWDSFCLVTPNWQCRLPGHPYSGDDPDGFMLREQIVEYVESFAASFAPPVWENTDVTRVTPDEDGGFELSTDAGQLTVGQVALCVSGYHRPRVPELSVRLPPGLTQLHSSEYRNPDSLPDGAVLVVGTGQSGAQLAEALLLGGRAVHLAVGSAPRVSRRYRGRDCIAWLEDIGHYNLPVDEHPRGVEAARHEPNHYMTGRDGGHDIDLRAHALAGMNLHGRLGEFDGRALSFAGDLPANLDGADATNDRIKDTIDEFVAREGIDAPGEERYVPVWEPPSDGSEPLDLAAAAVRSVVWATGFTADWSWVDVQGYLAEDYPRHERGICDVDGLYVLGLPWLWTWGSGRFAGVGRDAEHVADRIVERARLAQAA